MSEWRTIGSAPRKKYRSGESVLLWAKPFFEETQDFGKARCFVGYWCIMHSKWVEEMQGMTDAGTYAYEIIPTHWMPLPGGPK